MGNYNQCIYESNKLKPSSAEKKLERDVFMYRAYMAQRKFGVVLDEIKSDAAKELVAIRHLAEYLSAPSERKEALAAAADKALTTGVDDVIGPLMAANIHFYDGEFAWRAKMPRVVQVFIKTFALTLRKLRGGVEMS